MPDRGCSKTSPKQRLSRPSALYPPEPIFSSFHLQKCFKISAISFCKMKKGPIFRGESHSDNDLLNQDMADVIRNAGIWLMYRCVSRSMEHFPRVALHLGGADASAVLVGVMCAYIAWRRMGKGTEALFSKAKLIPLGPRLHPFPYMETPALADGNLPFTPQVEDGRE